MLAQCTGELTIRHIGKLNEIIQVAWGVVRRGLEIWAEANDGDKRFEAEIYRRAKAKYTFWAGCNPPQVEGKVYE